MDITKSQAKCWSVTSLKIFSSVAGIIMKIPRQRWTKLGIRRIQTRTELIYYIPWLYNSLAMKFADDTAGINVITVESCFVESSIMFLWSKDWRQQHQVSSCFLRIKVERTFAISWEVIPERGWSRREWTASVTQM